VERKVEDIDVALAFVLAALTVVFDRQCSQFAGGASVPKAVL
jgi:hypothetical protein